MNTIKFGITKKIVTVTTLLVLLSFVGLGVVFLLRENNI